MMRNPLIRHRLKAAVAFMRHVTKAILGYPFIVNANGVDEAQFDKRALLIYVTEAFSIRSDHPTLLTHQNLKQATQIAEVLGELGYVVDVADYLDNRLFPKHTYDLVISHRVDIGGMERALRRGTLKVYLATGMNHVIRNRIMREAYAEVSKRKGCQLEVSSFHSENMPFVSRADAIVGFGNSYTVGSWKEVSNATIYPFNNYGFVSTKSSVVSKDFALAKKRFLFFASGSQVRKGLDLLLEAFVETRELHLYVCSPFFAEREFCKCYHRELFETPNIHPIGWVGVNSPQFEHLMTECAFVIHPAREEGQPGSVVQCMYAGLIPLVSIESGIDTDAFGRTFRDCSRDEIVRSITELSNLAPSELKSLSQNTRASCERKFSEDYFCTRWKEMIREIERKGARVND